MECCAKVYTWGSGYCGQLAQGDVMVALKPEVVQHLLDLQVHAIPVHVLFLAEEFLET